MLKHMLHNKDIVIERYSGTVQYERVDFSQHFTFAFAAVEGKSLVIRSLFQGSILTPDEFSCLSRR